MAVTFVNFRSNVGAIGGDLATRRVALGIMLATTFVAIPWFHFTHNALKVVALLGAMTGTLFLMSALVFLRNTHYAGLALIPAPLAMVGLSALNLRWVAVFFGLAVITALVQNLVTRRCGLNKLLGINSCTCEP
jgi:hypothetical protein